MKQQMTFHFDSNACSGCKACQTACKDKHNLAADQVWRNVFEVSGGVWQKAGDAWVPDVYAYHLSISCNHCEKPICAEVCPAKALSKRDDGIVVLDNKKCLGCGYCSWVCPYNALQYIETEGHMSKCTFCADELDEGKPPSCVSACPMRVLDYGGLEDIEKKYEHQSKPASLPNNDLTEPSLSIHAHHADRTDLSAKIFPAKQAGLQERSLVAFTLLSQMAAGAAVILGLLNLFPLQQLWILSFNKTAYPVIGLIMAGSMMFSLFHLGTPLKFYRSILNIKTSWLSREIIAAALLIGMISLSGLSYWADGFAFFTSQYAGSLPAFFGIVFIFSMSRIYMMRTVPVWNTFWTMLSFYISSFILGLTCIFVLSQFAGMNLWKSINQFQNLLLLLIVLLGIEIIVRIKQRQFFLNKIVQADGNAETNGCTNLYRCSTAFNVSAIILLVPAVLFTDLPWIKDQTMILMIVTGVIILAAEVIGRYIFYKSYFRYGV